MKENSTVRDQYEGENKPVHIGIMMMMMVMFAGMTEMSAILVARIFWKVTHG